MDRIATVSTDGTVTESDTHDPSGNVTSQTISGTTTSYDYCSRSLKMTMSPTSAAKQPQQPQKTQAQPSPGR